MSGKTVSSSRVRIVQQMTQLDANMGGNIHGSTILKLIDNTAAIVAARHSGGRVITASIDRVDFHAPVHVSDLLRVNASLNWTGRTSMEIGVRVEAEEVISGAVRHTGSAYSSHVRAPGFPLRRVAPPGGRASIPRRRLRQPPATRYTARPSMTRPMTTSRARHVVGRPSGPERARAPNPSPVNHTALAAIAPAANAQRRVPWVFARLPSMTTVSR